ncbi:DUF3649 domain-containing protein [Janthinobacterium fluminis]|uniref:DUF3649 domain-containing protein n=1 Tax=Janthinobacterium fluminis TaxID=2987524 RepID=A0ABT5K150_9BURK|nr:DUF3649 domain-containing protein [Janthinobacterium fluminis]MDC8758708.1 DUF3649 domain-containing protein [Janthinobacterium fluminis]
MSAAQWTLCARVGAAVVGGYALTSAVAVLLAALLPLPKAEAVLAAGMSSFVVYTGAVIWVFAVAGARRAWLGLMVPALLLGALGWLLSRGGA